MKKFNCLNYSNCLDMAAKINKQFDCSSCREDGHPIFGEPEQIFEIGEGPGRKRIRDEFADLKISSSRKHQLRMRKKGLCWCCGQSLPLDNPKAEGGLSASRGDVASDSG